VSRPNRALRRCAATALVLVSALTWIPLAGASGGGSLTRQYPLGSQTLCCHVGSRHSSSSSSSTATTITTRPSRGHGGVSILLVVVIGVIAFAPAAFIFRAGLSPRGLRRGSRPEPVVLAPLPDEGALPGVSRKAVAGPASDLEEVAPSAVEDGDAAFNRGVVLYEQGDLGSAEAAWRRAAESHHARAATRLGMALERRGDLDGASEAYRDAERWGDPVESERAAALRRPDQPSAQSRPAEEPVSE
jgi:hypothetical protein